MAGFPQRNQLVGTHVWTGNARQDAQASQNAFDTLALFVNQLRNGEVIDGAITLAKLAALTGLSVIGNATNASGTPTAITAGSDGHILRRNGSTLGFGKILTNFITGTSTNDNATAGDIGEYTSATAAENSVTTWTTGVVKNITSVSLTAGDWDVSGTVQFGNGAITGSECLASICLTSAAFDTTIGISAYPAVPPLNVDIRIPVARRRISIASTTTVYLVGRIGFTAGTPQAGGTITARRVR